MAGDNTYQRVRALPERMQKARNKIVKYRIKLENCSSKHLSQHIQALGNAERALRNLENEARQYNFLDLLEPKQ